MKQVADRVAIEITTQNVLAQAAANDTFETLARNERDNPCLPVLDDPYPVYTSRGNVHNLLELTGQPILTDFGSSRMGNTAVPNRGWWMPDTYRAPEISMGLPWGYEIDVWSVGIMVSSAHLLLPPERSPLTCYRPLNFLKAEICSIPSIASTSSTCYLWH